MDDASPEVVVDARGHHCPVPTLKLRRALAAAAPGARLTLLATDPMARIDVPHFLAEVGATLVEVREDGRELTFSIVNADNGVVSARSS
jgi:tRNA 2-thiouridine synthesizing protein A